jgi:uncharacterized membrane protein YtjA (UPF0391 family)
MTSNAPRSVRPRYRSQLPLAVVVAAVPAAIANVVIAAIAHSAGVSHSFVPLQFTSFVTFTVLGLIAGAFGWTSVRSRATHPAKVLKKLVPAVVILSFIPDVIVGATHGEAATTWGGISGLMVMHLVVATTGVLSYRAFLPLA